VGWVGAAFGPASILSLYWPRMNRNGALAGILVGGITVVIWKQLSGGLFDIFEIVPGFIFASVAIVVVSVATKRPGDNVLSLFGRVEKKLSKK